MSAPALLYKLRVRVLYRYFSAADSRKRWQYGMGAVFGGIVFFVVLFFSLGFFRALLGTGSPTGNSTGSPGLAAAALSGTFNLATVILTTTGLAAALYTLYLSDDLEVLFAKPLKERTIFGYKFLETLLTNTPLFLLTALPISLAYGIAASGRVLSVLLFLVALPVVSALLLTLPTALCILFSMPLMRILPASRAKEIVAGVGAILGAVLYLAYLHIISPDAAEEPVNNPGGNDPGGSATEGLSSALRPLLESPAVNLPPGSWAAGALSGAASVDWAALLSGLGFLVALAAAAYLLCLAVAGWAYATGRAQAAEAGARVGTSHLEGPVSGKLFALLPRRVRTVAFKELRTLRRDFRRLASVAAPVIIVLGVFFVNSGGLPAAGEGPWFVSLFPFLPAVAAGGILSSLLAAYSVGAEGRAYWYLQASPLGPAELMAGKLAASVACGAGASLLCSFAVAFATGLPSADFPSADFPSVDFPSAVGLLFGVLGGTVAGTVAAAVCGLYGIGISAMFANFEGTNPNQALSQIGNFMMMFSLFGLFVAAGLAAALAFGLSAVIPAGLAVLVAALVWAVGCAAGGYAVAASGVASLQKVDQ